MTSFWQNYWMAHRNKQESEILTQCWENYPHFQFYQGCWRIQKKKNSRFPWKILVKFPDIWRLAEWLREIKTATSKPKNATFAYQTHPEKRMMVVTQFSSNIFCFSLTFPDFLTMAAFFFLAPENIYKFDTSTTCARIFCHIKYENRWVWVW